MKSKFLAFLCVLFFAAFTGSVTLHAQTTTGEAQQQGQAENPFSDSTAWTSILDSTEQAVSREGVTEVELDKLFNDVGRLREAALQEIQRLQGQVDQVRRQLNELGEAPAEGAPPEAPEVQERRKVLNETFATVDAELKRARLADVRSQQIRKSIADNRHSRFLQSITQRSDGITTVEFWGKFITGFRGYQRSFRLLLTDSVSVFIRQFSQSLQAKFLLPFFLILTLLIFVRVRRYLGQLIANEESRFSLQNSNRNVYAFIYYLRNGILPAILPYPIFRVFSDLGLLTARLDQLLVEMAVAFGFAIASLVLFRVFFSPGNYEYRIADVPDRSASKIYKALATGVIAATFIFILNRTTVVLVSPLQLSIALSMFFAIVIGITSLRALYVYRRGRKATAPEESTRLPSRGWNFLATLVWIVTIVILISAFAGFVALAEYLSTQLLFGLVVVLSGWLLLRFIDYLFLHLSVEKFTDETEPDSAASGIGGSGQLLILGAGITKLLVYCVAGILLMLPWGYRTSDFFEIFNSLFFGFEVGGLRISISTVLLAIGLFGVGYVATQALKNWLNEKYLPTTSLDIGISNSISTVFGYIGIILALVLAVSVAGLDLSNLAIVAGALSVGVGFGLQSIVNNFVSGLILLAERPIKAGDWIVTAGGQGYVKKISVRSTEIETFDRSTVIVPNSTLITDTVTNWTHGNKSGRLIVAVGVSYDADPEQVQQILLDCAKSHKMVLSRPAPAAYFMDFGPSSLDFELRCFLGDINWMLSVQSELRVEILKALREADIEIPFPQRVVNLRGPEQDLAFDPD